MNHSFYILSYIIAYEDVLSLIVALFFDFVVPNDYIAWHDDSLCLKNIVVLSCLAMF